MPARQKDGLASDSWYVAQDMPSPGAARTDSSVFSGFVFDASRGRIIKRGGGHCDYKGTEVQEFDAVTTFSWSTVKAGVPDTEFLAADHFDNDNYPGAVVVLEDGSAPTDFADAVANGLAAPIARHTTNSTTMIGSTGEFFMTGMFTYGEGGGVGGTNGCSTGASLPYGWTPFDAWAYNPRSRTWRYLARHTVDMEWVGCAWVPNGPGVSDNLGAVFCVTEQNRQLHRYDVSSDSWRIANNGVPAVSLGTNLTYSEQYQSLYYYLDGDIWQFDLVAGRWNSVSITGSGISPGYSATAYDSVNNAIGIWNGDNLYICEMTDAQSCNWTTASTADMPSGSGFSGNSSNFAYDPTNNVFWAANGANTIKLGAYRFKGGQPGEGTVPEPPTNLEANQ